VLGKGRCRLLKMTETCRVMVLEVQQPRIGITGWKSLQRRVAARKRCKTVNYRANAVQFRHDADGIALTLQNCLYADCSK